MTTLRHKQARCRFHLFIACLRLQWKEGAFHCRDTGYNEIMIASMIRRSCVIRRTKPKACKAPCGLSTQFRPFRGSECCPKALSTAESLSIAVSCCPETLAPQAAMTCTNAMVALSAASWSHTLTGDAPGHVPMALRGACGERPLKPGNAEEQLIQIEHLHGMQ